MIKIGITGGIGSGKSTICRLFAVLGVAVYNSDSRARNLMQSDTEVISAIRALFGDNAYIHGSLNRPYIAPVGFPSTGPQGATQPYRSPRCSQRFRSVGRKATGTLCNRGSGDPVRKWSLPKHGCRCNGQYA